MTLRVLQGDVLQQMRLHVADESVDAVVTDPPYSSGALPEARKGVRKSMTSGIEDGEWFGSDSLTVSGFAHLMRECAIEWRRVLKPGGHALVFIDWRMAGHLAAAIESADLRWMGTIVWDKMFPTMGTHFRYQHEFVLHFAKHPAAAAQRRDVPNVIRCKPVRGQNKDHPTEKPVDLLRTLLSVVAPPRGIVLDPFLGSGTTLVAADELGMSGIGVEREPHFLNVANRRLATRQTNFSHQQETTS